MAVHQQSVSAVLKHFDVDPEQGLSSEEAERRLEEAGPNRLRKVRQRPWWRIFVDQFTSPVVVLLIVAAAVAVAFGEVVEGIAISVALIINAGIGFVTEWRARQSMEALHAWGR